MTGASHERATAARHAAIRRCMEAMLAAPMTALQLAEAVGVTISCCRQYIKEGIGHKACGVVGAVSTRTKDMLTYQATSAAAIDAMLVALEQHGSMLLVKRERARSDGGKATRRRLLAEALAIGRRIINGDDVTYRFKVPAAAPVPTDDNPIISGAWLARGCQS